MGTQDLVHVLERAIDEIALTLGCNFLILGRIAMSYKCTMKLDMAAGLHKYFLPITSQHDVATPQSETQ